MTIVGIKTDKQKFPLTYRMVTAAIGGLSFPIESISTDDYDTDGYTIVKLPNGNLVTSYFLITK